MVVLFLADDRILTLKFSAVAVSAVVLMAFIPTFANVSTLFFPRMFSGVTTIWIASDTNRSGIQNVRVFQTPLP